MIQILAVRLTDNSIEDNDFISYEDLDIDMARRIPFIRY